MMLGQVEDSNGSPWPCGPEAGGFAEQLDKAWSARGMTI